jgi:ketosteroid isomerase-like protein
MNRESERDKKRFVKMKEEIDEMLDYLTNMTKEQADFIQHVLNWSAEAKLAFIIAKQILNTEKNNGSQKT